MIKGKVLEVTEKKSFSNGDKEYSYRNILFDIGDNKMLYTTLWGKVPPPEVGSVVLFNIEVTSERNRKDPSLFFHKIKLKYYENFDRVLFKQVQLGERIWDTWEGDPDW